MDKQSLHEKLQQLHSELHQIELIDENERKDLQHLMADIQELLEQSEEHPANRYTRLGERLRDSIERLEATHPTITMLMGQTADMLAKMGI